MVLRITHGIGWRFRALLKLEGAVVSEWTSMLERECLEVMKTRGGLSLDLADVTLVDRAGIETLARLSRAGVEIRCSPGVVAEVLEGEGIPVVAEREEVNR